ncbi:hypothetical protein RAA17_04245 [Komagataeibacter rhaeticus]|nr:hypothetical protein [Komagataeibacter rhaeticus]
MVSCCCATGRTARAPSWRRETWLRRAALAGDREAAALLGDLHARGEAALPGDHEAVTWYRMAAEHGHAVACRMLALLYAGAGVAADPAQARHWLARAAALGDAAAMTDLAATLLPEVSPVPRHRMEYALISGPWRRRATRLRPSTWRSACTGAWAACPIMHRRRCGWNARPARAW